MLLFRLSVRFATNDQSLIESDSGWLPLSFVSSTAICDNTKTIFHRQYVIAGILFSFLYKYYKSS